ncbi:stress response protein nst1 [Drosophila mojavensis]|uniref:stress response protein nst1 n=1 Tax=Drosophila mojavensis TaxID=7230 RepID=UPI001CD082B2|nr:stress response protein nst1 [Drosophila mojavensis]
MRSHSCVWALIVAVLWLALASREVNGETRIEVDENGDEYELKRFYIQGRQLNGQGSKSQCVVTRRKRSSRSMSAPSISVSSQQLSLDAGTEPLKLQQEQDSNKRRYVALAAVQLQQPEDEDDEDDDEEDDEDDGDEQQLEIEEAFLVDAVQQKQFPGQSQNSFVAFTQKVPGGVSVVANAATHANVVGDAGIVVVESQEPPKVNPNTHAVFELKPLNQPSYYQPGAPLLGGDEAAEEEDEDEEDNIDSDGFYYQGLGVYDEYEHFITEDSPVSTSAVWSTDGDDEDVQPVVNPANRPVNENKKKRKQQQQQKQKRRKQQQQKRRKPQQKKKKRPANELQAMNGVEQGNKQQQLQQSVSVSSVDQTAQKPIGNSSSSSSSGSGSGSSTPVKRRKSKPKQKKKKKSRPSSVGNRRRRPSSSSSSSASYSYGSMGGYRRRRPQLTEAQRRRRQQQKRRRQQLQRQRRRRNKIRQQNGIGGGYRQQYFGDEPIVNCIYINKDPVTTTTTTTPRPFWNLLGRSAAQQPQLAEQSPRRNGEFGNRKRTNLKFTA